MSDRTRSANALYIPTLDGWRAIAIVLVLICHSSDQLMRGVAAMLGRASAMDVRPLGLLGVQIFFALSGFLITTRLLEEERHFGNISLRQFYLRRAFRILPAALGFLAVVGALAWFGMLEVTAGRWLSAALFFANYSTAKTSWYLGHFWSLAVEEHFYMIWPLMFIGFGWPKGRLRSVIIMLLLVTIWRGVAFKYQLTFSDPAVFWGRTDIVADNLLFGVASALIYDQPELWARWRILIVSRIFSLLLLALVLSTTLLEPHDWKVWMFFWSFKATAIPLLIGGTVLRAQAGATTPLESSTMRWVGRLSYSLYLWQQLFLVWDESQVPGLALLQTIPLNYACAVACAYVSYRWLEKPMIRFGRRFLNSMPRNYASQ
jgi:peptidoglycan/LPS O-acetylase OafA/YrhL